MFNFLWLHLIFINLFDIVNRRCRLKAVPSQNVLMLYFHIRVVFLYYYFIIKSIFIILNMVKQSNFIQTLSYYQIRSAKARPYCGVMRQIWGILLPVMFIKRLLIYIERLSNAGCYAKGVIQNVIFFSKTLRACYERILPVCLRGFCIGCLTEV